MFGPTLAIFREVVIKKKVVMVNFTFYLPCIAV